MKHSLRIQYVTRGSFNCPCIWTLNWSEFTFVRIDYIWYTCCFKIAKIWIFPFLVVSSLDWLNLLLLTLAE